MNSEESLAQCLSGIKNLVDRGTPEVDARKYYLKCAYHNGYAEAMIELQNKE